MFGAPLKIFLQLLNCKSIQFASTLKNDGFTSCFEQDPQTPTVEVEVANQGVDLKGGRMVLPPPSDTMDPIVAIDSKTRAILTFVALLI